MITDTGVDALPGAGTSPAPAGRAAAGLAGLLAAAAALATAELVAGLVEDAPSLVVGVADVFVAETPGGIVRWSIRTLGASQKTVLLSGVVVMSLGLGALLGLLARRRPTGAAAGLATFGVVGARAAAGMPGTSTTWAWATAVLAVAAGVGVLRLLLRLARRPVAAGDATAAGPGPGDDGRHAATPTAPRPGTVDRRRFLVTSGAVAAVATLGAGVGGWLRRGRNVEGARRELAARLDAPPPTVPPDVTAFDDTVPGISPLVTPNADFYRIDTALLTPQVEPADWSLRVTGMVDREVALSLGDLLVMDHVAGFVTLACVSNDVGGDLVGNAVWSGVPLSHLLDLAGARPDASQVVGRSVDGWTSGFPTELARDGRLAMVALAMNGEPLPAEHGFPARLVVPGLYGYVSATKWLTEIELTTLDGFDAYWVPRGWAKDGPIRTQSRIDVPQAQTTVRAGPARAAGVAWAPTRGIERVEVRVDDGPWRPARLSGALSGDAWVQWVLDWDATPGSHRLEVRAVDGTGETQTAEPAPPAPSGATGHHAIRITAA